MAAPVVLVINPGSTSTRTAVFHGEALSDQRHIECCAEVLTACARMTDQVGYRTEQVTGFLGEAGIELRDCDAIAARGGPLRPVPGGVYRVNNAMLEDACGRQFAEHPSKLGCVLAAKLGSPAGVPSFVVDPVSTDEYDDISRISGVKALPRKSRTHALNMRYVARRCAEAAGRPYEEMNIITAHLGGGISIAVHHDGRMIDSVDSNGCGPMSPERAGMLRTEDLAQMAMTTDMPEGQMHRFLTRRAGLIDHLQTSDCREVEARIAAGDVRAETVYRAMAYHIAKHICALAAAVSGRLDAVVLTGGLANSAMLTGWVTERVSFLAPVTAQPGQMEIEALHQGVMRVLTSQEKARVYPSGKYE